MATGRDNRPTKQVGGYLVAAELCGRGFIAATFAWNVSHYDIIGISLTSGCSRTSSMHLQPARPFAAFARGGRSASRYPGPS